MSGDKEAVVLKDELHSFVVRWKLLDWNLIVDLYWQIYWYLQITEDIIVMDLID